MDAVGRGGMMRQRKHTYTSNTSTLLAHRTQSANTAVITPSLACKLLNAQVKKWVIFFYFGYIFLPLQQRLLEPFEIPPNKGMVTIPIKRLG